MEASSRWLRLRLVSLALIEFSPCVETPAPDPKRAYPRHTASSRWPTICELFSHTTTTLDYIIINVYHQDYTQYTTIIGRVSNIHVIGNLYSDPTSRNGVHTCAISFEQQSSRRQSREMKDDCML